MSEITAMSENDQDEDDSLNGMRYRLDPRLARVEEEYDENMDDCNCCKCNNCGLNHNHWTHD